LFYRLLINIGVYLVGLGINERLLAVSSTISNSSSTNPTTTPRNEPITTSTYAGYGGVSIGLIASEWPQAAFSAMTVLGDRGSYSEASFRDQLMAIDAPRGWLALPVHETVISGLPRSLNAPFEVVRSQASGSSSMLEQRRPGIYVFSTPLTSAPQFQGIIGLETGTSGTLGLFFRSSSLYVIQSSGLSIYDVPALNERARIDW
jgi:hypothetical protein